MEELLSRENVWNDFATQDKDVTLPCTFDRATVFLKIEQNDEIVVGNDLMW